MESKVEAIVLIGGILLVVLSYFILATAFYFFILSLFGWVNIVTVILYLLLVGLFIENIFGKKEE